MNCPNATAQDENGQLHCHLCAHLAAGCFLRDIAPAIETDQPQPTAHCAELDIPFADLPMCQ